MAGDTTGYRKDYFEHLEGLRTSLLRMGAFTEEMLGRAMEALQTQDLDLARQVHRSDDVADDYDAQIEQQAIHMLASQQPVSRDLRMLLGALRIAGDMERAADYAKDIAKVAIAVGREPWHRPLTDVAAMSDLTREMLRQTLRALADQDAEQLPSIAAMDEGVDILWRKVWRELTDDMAKHADHAVQASYLILIARYLERVGDHIVNICERINYIVTGERELEPSADDEAG